MTAVPLLFQVGDTLAIRNDAASTDLWGVVERKRGGYLLRPYNGSDPRTWSDDEIDDVYGARRLTHFPCNLLGLPKNLADILDKTWEFWPEDVRRQAERRAVYVTMVDALIDEHPTRMAAYAAAAEAVYVSHRQQWEVEDAEFRIRRDAENAVLRRRRKPQRSDVNPLATPSIRKPNPYTVRSWYLLWSRYGRDIRLLIPHHHLRGNRRSVYPRERGEAPDTYKLMAYAIKVHYMGVPRKRKRYAYDQYVKSCGNNNVQQVSYRTFRVFIRENYTDRQEYEKRYGRRAAYLRFGVFDRTVLPERPLQEVEIDHCLIDLIVVHPDTGRPLGRPWLTAILDRATRVILGVHLSFEGPSYASLQRALAHAFWKKDLTGIEGIDHDWPCHGVPEWVICDNGKEFRSGSLHLSEAMLGFSVVNLPVKQPWLKGAIERLFGIIGVQVFSHQEGSILSRTKDFYDPVGRARRTLAEVNRMILQWIVDDYHMTVHGTLKCRPIEKWHQLTELYPVRPVPDFDHVIRMTGEVIRPKISNIGVHHDGLLYSDKRILEQLRACRGGLDKNWVVRVDPYDLGEIWILDDEVGGRWYVLPCADPEISRGVSKYQHKVHKLIARHNLPAGTPVTVSHLKQAKAMAEDTVRLLFEDGAKTSTATKAARYAANGEPFTPLCGGSAAATPLLPPSSNAHQAAPLSAMATQAASPSSAEKAAAWELESERLVEQWTRNMT